MVQIIQKIWAEESLPAQMVQGALVMLHKGGGKSKEDLKAYRPVILLPHCLTSRADCDRSDQLITGALLAETGTISMLAARRQLLRTSGVGQRIYLG